MISTPQVAPEDRFETGRRIRSLVEPHLKDIGKALLEGRRLVDETELRSTVEERLKQVVPAGIEVQAVTVDVTYNAPKGDVTLTLSAVVKQGENKVLASESFFGLDRSGFEKQEIEKVAERVRAVLAVSTEPITLESVNGVLERLGYTGKFTATSTGTSLSKGSDGVSSDVYFSIGDGTRTLTAEGYQEVPYLHRADVSI